MFLKSVCCLLLTLNSMSCSNVHHTSSLQQTLLVVKQASYTLAIAGVKGAGSQHKFTVVIADIPSTITVKGLLYESYFIPLKSSENNIFIGVLSNLFNTESNDVAPIVTAHQKPKPTENKTYLNFGKALQNNEAILVYTENDIEKFKTITLTENTNSLHYPSARQ